MKVNWDDYSQYMEKLKWSRPPTSWYDHDIIIEYVLAKQLRLEVGDPEWILIHYHGS